MSDVKQSFPILEDASASAGSAPTRTIVGDAALGKVGMTVFPFKDSSGNIVMVQLTPDSRVPVSSEPIGIRLRNRGISTNMSTSAMVLVATIPLTAGKNYLDPKMVVSCRRGCQFQMVFNNNGVKTILHEAMVDSGQYTFELDGYGDEFNASGSVSQSLDVQAQNFSVVSDAHATVWVTEQA